MLAEGLTTAQVARRLGLSQQQVIRLARAGVLEHVRTALGRLYNPESVERLAALRAKNGKQVASVKRQVERDSEVQK